jgi:predicted cobalt transporter CbtA
MIVSAKKVPVWGRVISGVVGAILAAIGFYWILAGVVLFDHAPNDGSWWLKLLFGMALFAAGSHSVVKLAVLARST